MAVRIRQDGRILCAAMHPQALRGAYLPDGITYMLTVEKGALVTDRNHLRYSDGSIGHGQWWWRGQVPPEIEKDQDDE